MTFEDQERVLPSRNLEIPIDPNQVKPRSRNALEVYDELQEKRIHEHEDIFDE